MVAVSFGSYATSLFIGDEAASWWDNVFTTAIVVAMVFVNFVGTKVVDRAQSLIVILLLGVFAVFIAVTLVDIDLDLLAFSGYPSFSAIIASVALTFFAYLGFKVITFAAGDLRDPTRELPKAMYGALGITTALDALISLGVSGRSPYPGDRLRRAAIAEAARPALGDAGFTTTAIAAMLATASSVLATLYASGGLTAMLAGAGQFPPFFGPGSPLGSRAGMLITAAIVLVVSDVVDLSAIASVGSACSLMIFLLVGISAYRLRAEIGANLAIVLLALATTAIVLAFFAVDTLRNSPETFVAIVAIAGLAVVLDLVWKRVRGAPEGPTETSAPSPSSVSSSGDRAVELVLRFARAGHEAGYPTADLEERVLALAETFGLDDTQVSATPTLVDVSFGAVSRQQSFALRVKPSSVDLDAIARLDELVQDVLEGKVDREATLARLDEMDATTTERPWPLLLARTRSPAPR